MDGIGKFPAKYSCKAKYPKETQEREIVPVFQQERSIMHQSNVTPTMHRDIHVWENARHPMGALFVTLQKPHPMRQHTVYWGGGGRGLRLTSPCVMSKNIQAHFHQRDVLRSSPGCTTGWKMWNWNINYAIVFIRFYWKYHECNQHFKSC